MEVNGGGKHSSLLQYSINYGRKMFYSTDPVVEFSAVEVAA
jgi:hypothetical protein